MEETEIRELLSRVVAEQYPRVSSEIIFLFVTKWSLNVFSVCTVG